MENCQPCLQVQYQCKASTMRGSVKNPMQTGMKLSFDLRFQSYSYEIWQFTAIDAPLRV